MQSRFGLKNALLLFGLNCFLIATVGCGKYSLSPVSGTVTLDGKPLADASVSFTPAERGANLPQSTGKTDQAGKYSLRLVEDDTTGAVLGKHQVIIAKSFVSESDVATEAEQTKAALPVHDFSFEVKSGSNKADFNLETKKGKK